MRPRIQSIPGGSREIQIICLKRIESLLRIRDSFRFRGTRTNAILERGESNVENSSGMKKRWNVNGEDGEKEKNLRSPISLRGKCRDACSFLLTFPFSFPLLFPLSFPSRGLRTLQLKERREKEKGKEKERDSGNRYVTRMKNRGGGRNRETEEVGKGRKDKMDGSQSDGEAKWPTVNLINTSSVLRERVEDRARPRKCQGRNNSFSSVLNRIVEVDTPSPLLVRFSDTAG